MEKTELGREMSLKMDKSGVKVQEIAKTAALEALRIHKSEEREKTRKSRYHNTELLLTNYMSLLDHYENSKDKASEDLLESLGCDDMDPDDVIIQVIKRSRVRTMVMITQIETCVDILRVKMTDKNQPEKYEVIYRLYLDKTRSKIPWSERIKAVAQELYCSTDSVRRWRKEMIDELSILIFGIDGLKLDI